MKVSKKRKIQKRNYKPQVIILLGPPGAGKGVQAELLAERFDFYYFETSKIIEQNVMSSSPGQYVSIGGKKYSLFHEKKLWRSGILCSPPLVSYWVKQRIRELYRGGNGIIMAGSPRTIHEGKDQVPLLKKLYGAKNIKIVLIELKPRDTIWRNSRRRICKLMRHPILYTKETAALKRCPLDGSRLMRRKGLDDPATIKIRLEEYKNRTFPLVAYFKKEGFQVKKVNGAPSVEKVFHSILKALT